MNTVSPKHFLEDQIPYRIQALIPKTLRLAYDTANTIVQNEPVLQVESALPNKGRIVSYAVDLAMTRLIDSGQWPVRYIWKKFTLPTGCYLQIMLSHSFVTISQVSEPNKQPRNVRFRENSRLSNQRLLFDSPEDRSEVEGRPGFLLVHGHQDLSFAHFGVPHRDHQSGYIYLTNNLLRLPHETESYIPPIEQTDIEQVISFREEIEKWLGSHREEDESE